MRKLLLIVIIGLFSCHDNNSVYLCNGPYSKVYHKTAHCQGLKSCSTDIEAVDMATAKTRHRRACRYCYIK